MAASARGTRGHRIGVGGIAIECNTFTALPSTIEDFEVLRGPAMQERYPFMPGWAFPDRPEIAWLPALQASALPGGPISEDSYRRLKTELLDRVRAELPLDGFYLDIHGAMAVAGLDDAEADLAAALRALVGPACLISAGMDLHGNVSPRLVELVDAFTAYRHAPHTDVVETRERACANLLRCLDDGLRPIRAWARVPVALPGERTATTVEPGRGLYGSLAASNARADVIDASLWIGYVWADEPWVGGSVVVTGLDASAARREAERIARRYWDLREQFDLIAPAGSADWCIDQALAADQGPAFISDAGDNPTAGAPGDVPYLLERLLARPELAGGDRTAVFAGIPDAAAVEAAVAAGVGEEVAVALGGKLDRDHGRPLEVRAKVLDIGSVDRRGGRAVVLQAGGVKVVVTSQRKAFTEAADFSGLGLDPAAHDLAVVKLGYLFPELQGLAKAAFMALTPGASDLDIPRLRFERVQRPIYPLDPGMADPAFDVRVFRG